MNKSEITPRNWFGKLDKLYAPDRYVSQGLVLLLSGHVNDLFYGGPKHAAIPLHQLLLARYRDWVDAFVWYGYPSDEQGAPLVGSTSQMHLTYEYNKFPTPEQQSPAFSKANLDLDDPLLQIQEELGAVSNKFRQELLGQASYARDPQSAIQEIQEALFSVPGNLRAVIVFEDVFWRVEHNQILGVLRKWPDICQTGHHLVVIAQTNDNLAWVDACFGGGQKGVARLVVDGPTPEEVKAFLIQQYLSHRREYFDWRLIDALSTQLASLCAPQDKGYKWLAREYLPNIIFSQSAFLGKEWSERQPKAGQRAEEVLLTSLVLQQAEFDLFDLEILPAFRDLEWRKVEAQRLNLDPTKIRVPNRILLVGPPGAGKTTIAKMIATESGLPFYSVGAAEFQSIYRGGPVEKVQAQFNEWRRNAPCVVFWDEVESVAASRSNAQHADDAITQILKELEPAAGKDEDLFIVCATNMPEKLDPAFTQRFRQVMIGYPDQEGLRKLVELYFPIHLLDDELSLDKLAKMFVDRTGREVSYCADACVGQLMRYQEDTITYPMVAAWLVDNPVDPDAVRRWRAEEDLREKKRQAYNLPEE